MKNERGFTLIELMLVVAIIAVLASIVFTSLQPAARFADARDARRMTDTASIAEAVKLHALDNGGTYLSEITATPTEICRYE